MPTWRRVHLLPQALGFFLGGYRVTGPGLILVGQTPGPRGVLQGRKEQERAGGSWGGKGSIPSHLQFCRAGMEPH